MPTRVGFPAGFLALHNRQVITMKNDFYTYAYLREDGTPYYIGKGSGRRAFNPHINVKVPPKERILILKANLTEEEAFRHEIYMIAVFGRKDIGTGILWNFTDGGGSNSGWVRTEEWRKNMSEAQKGKKHSEETKEKIRQGNLGKKQTPEAKRKLSEAKKGKGKPWSELRWERFRKKEKAILSEEAIEQRRQAAKIRWEKWRNKSE